MRLAGLVAVGTTVLTLSSADPTARDAAELSTVLAEAAGAIVDPLDLRWEPSRGVLHDAVVGRFVLFLGAGAPAQPRDVYRARVRVTPEGRPLGVAAVRNLTGTPLGDDHALVVSGGRAAFATAAFGQEQSVTLLDLEGEGEQNVTRKIHDRAMAWVTNVQQTGSGGGVGRVDLTLDQPAQRVGLALGAHELSIELADDPESTRATRTARFDLEKGDFAAVPAGLHAEAGRHLPKRFIFWAVDTVRAVPWIGPAPIAWLEEKTFAVRDHARQAVFRAAGGGEALAREPDAPVAASILDGAAAASDPNQWPPPSVASIWKKPEPGEGEWSVPALPWMKRLPAAPRGEPPPAAFYRTFVRPDEERPYAKVLLVAMDMRQLDLHMEAGNEDPKPMTGPPGTGRIPRDARVYTRVAAAFNGGFKTEHGSYGMMVNKRILLPPAPGAATILVTKDTRVGMGSWGTAKDVSGIRGIASEDILSFRQNLDPLVADGTVNPMGRWQWGFTLPGTSMQTERSGICVTRAGHLLYAWGDDVSAITLGKAMNMAGCVYGMHLDMNPHHTGFIFTNITALKGRDYKSELLSRDMEIMPDRYIEYAPKDFFYMTLHDPSPPELASASWEPDEGVQPAPSWLAGLWRAKKDDIEVLDVEPARASFRLRAGVREPDSGAGATRAHELSGDDANKVLFALTLGTSEPKHLRGLVTDGKIALPMSSTAEASAVLVASEEGEISIVQRDALGTIAPRVDAAELPLVVSEGEVIELPRAPRAPAVLGITAQGRVYVARSGGHATAEDVATLLVSLGAVRAVLLDRGAGGHGALFRAGTQTPPRSRYDDTTLYAMAKPLAPRGFRFEPTSPVPPPQKKK